MAHDQNFATKIDPAKVMSLALQHALAFPLSRASDTSSLAR